MRRFQKTYEFTAFAEADLLQGGDQSLGRGDSFVMPSGATTTLEVQDNDKRLSGDFHKKSWLDDHARDPFGQNAAANGDQLKGQIFAEQRHILKGSDGKIYQLIEIEAERDDAPGAGDDFFTFFGAVPPAGVTLTVMRSKDVFFGLKYDKLGAGPKVEEDTASISGRYFCDDDGDGLDDSDPGVADAIVILRSADGTIIDRTTTDDDGLYSFDDLLAGEYVVEFSRDSEPDKAFVSPNAGDSTNDSDVINLERGLTGVISVRDEQDVKDIDAGIAYTEPTATLSGRYFCDVDADGLDDGEPGVIGAFVILRSADGAIVERTTTDDDGMYSFDYVLAGDYVVEFSRDTEPGKRFVAPSAGDGTNDSDVIDLDAGLTGVITVRDGQDVRSIDAGITYLDAAPDAFVFADALSDPNDFFL